MSQPIRPQYWNSSNCGQYEMLQKCCMSSCSGWIVPINMEIWIYRAIFHKFHGIRLLSHLWKSGGLQIHGARSGNWWISISHANIGVPNNRVALKLPYGALGLWWGLLCSKEEDLLAMERCSRPWKPRKLEESKNYPYQNEPKRTKTEKEITKNSLSHR